MVRQKENLEGVVVNENLLTNEPTNLPSLCKNERQIGGAIPTAIQDINQQCLDEGFGEGSKKRGMDMSDETSHERMTKKHQLEKPGSLESDVSTTQWEVKAKLRAKEYYDRVHKFDFGPTPFQHFGYKSAYMDARNNKVIELEKRVDEHEKLLANVVRRVNELRGTPLQTSNKNLKIERSASLKYDSSTTQWQLRGKMGDKEFYDHIHTLDIVPASSQLCDHRPAFMAASEDAVTRCLKKAEELRELSAALTREIDRLSATPTLVEWSATGTHANTEE